MRDCIRRNADALFFHVIASHHEQEGSASPGGIRISEDPLPCRTKGAIDRSLVENCGHRRSLALIITIERPDISSQ